MHYSLITLRREAIESALLRAIFINRTHVYTNAVQELFPCDLIIGNDIGRACGTYGEDKHLAGFWWGNRKKGAYFNDLGVNGSVILTELK
jgi:hypothetical protein